MTSTDKLVTPIDVDLSDPSVKKVIQELRAEFIKTRLKIKVDIEKGDFPPVMPNVSMKKQFQAQGREFEMTARGALDQPTTFTMKDITEQVRKKREEIERQEEKAEESVIRQIQKRISNSKKNIDKRQKNEEMDVRAEERIQAIIDDVRKKEDAVRKKKISKRLAESEREDKAEEDFIKQISANLQKRIQKDKKRLENRQKADELDVQTEENIQKSITDTRQKQKSKLDRQGLQDLKTKITGLDEQEQIKAIDEYIANGGAFVNQVNAIRRSLTNKINAQSKNLKRTKFTDWTKQLQTIDPLQAINQLDAYIATRGNQFINDAKILRQRIAKQMQQQQAAAQQQKNRNFANNILIGASAGIGLFGQAGFPLLNIGFAAMSGNVVGAGVAAVTTAIGETARALNRIREESIGAARELGAVSSGLKSVEARMKAFDAFSAQGALAAQRLGMEDRLKIFKENPNAFLAANTLTQNISEAFKQRLVAIPSGSDRGIMQYLPQDVRFLADVIDRQKRTREELPSELQSSLRNMQMQMMRPTVGIETDPYQTWLRIQNSAFDPMKQEEVKYQREMIKMYQEMIKALNNNTNSILGGGWAKSMRALAGIPF